MTAFQEELDDFRRTPDGKIIQGAAHTCMVLNHKVRNKIIIKAVCDLRKINNEFDSIVCSGVSGLIITPQVSEILNKHLIIVRKKNEERYSEFTVEGTNPGRYIILDDLICSNNTVKHIMKSIKEESTRSICIGAYFYLPEECSYKHNADGDKLFKKDLGIKLLNI